MAEPKLLEPSIKQHFNSFTSSIQEHPPDPTPPSTKLSPHRRVPRKRSHSFPNPIPAITVTPPDNNDHLEEVIETARTNQTLRSDFTNILNTYEIEAKKIDFELCKPAPEEEDEGLKPVVRVVTPRDTRSEGFGYVANDISQALFDEGFGGFGIRIDRQTKRDVLAHEALYCVLSTVRKVVDDVLGCFHVD